jgi:tetratricopeptide (TPR) repeat protein
MIRHAYLFVLLLLAAAIAGFAQEPADSSPNLSPKPDSVSPAFTTVPELSAAFDLLYSQKFTEARDAFAKWEARNPDQPFGQVAVAATFLYEELFRQGVLTSDFFLNEKKFLHGIEGKPDLERMNNFRGALTRTRELARERMKTRPKDPEALFALTLAAGMESDADSMLEKKQLDALKRMKEANEYAKQLLLQRPDAADAYIAMGIANYIIGSLNPGFRFALWFGGIHGDKRLGMEQVGRTVENGRYLQPFAKIMLALAARREKQNALAQKLLRELSEQFPENTLFAAEYAKAMGLPVPAIISR